MTSSDNSKIFMLIPRKVQRLGASSLIVTIPKDWAHRNGVNVGDVISLIDVGDRLIILPKNYTRRTVISFDGKHKRVVMHIGRLSLCGFIFGQDRIIVNTPRQGTVKEILERLERVMRLLPYIYVQGKGKQVVIDLESPIEDPWTAFKGLGKYTVSYIESLLETLNKGDSREEVLDNVESLRLEALRSSFRLLRAITLSDARGGLESILGLYLFLYASMLSLAIEEFHETGVSILKLRDKLSEEELERVKFLLQLLEVAIATLSANIDPNSVKKVEEAYWKLKSVLDLSQEVEDIVESGTPAYAYIVGKLIGIASTLELAGSVMACYMVTQKYSERVNSGGEEDLKTL